MLDARARLLAGLAPGAVLGALAPLQVAGRHHPEAGARLDRPAAQQDAVLPAAHRADHDLGIEVVDLAARGADVALERVALGPAQHDRGAALAAKRIGAARQPFLNSASAAPCTERLASIAARARAISPSQTLDVGLELLDRPGREIGRLGAGPSRQVVRVFDHGRAPPFHARRRRARPAVEHASTYRVWWRPWPDHRGQGKDRAPGSGAQAPTQVSGAPRRRSPGPAAPASQ